MNVRDILYGPVQDGFFVVPKETFTKEDEVAWSKRRMDSVRIAQYADSKCGLPNTYDETGAYICSTCNKREGTECLIRIKNLSKPDYQGCAYWEMTNAGDPEGRYSPDGKLEDKRIGFGETKNPKGWGCIRCEYYISMPKPDSENRPGWCKKKGHTVEMNSCCWDNDPIDYADVLDKRIGDSK